MTTTLAGKYTRLVSKTDYVPFSNDFHTSTYIECLKCHARLTIGWLREKSVVAQVAKEFIGEHRHCRHGVCPGHV